jgi:Zn-dependent protease with chaperone function/uncharacterized tellurite resistance protein B-like protein
MDFFAQQDHARQRTRRLIVYFILAVLSIVLLVNVLIAVVLNIAAPSPRVSRDGAESTQVERPETTVQVSDPSSDVLLLHGGATILVLLIIGLGSWYKILSLSSGGRQVAESLGGRRVRPGDNKKLLNIVEEMCIASGLPMPEVYVLEEEKSINAFAAGYSPSDAVIAVTQGALDNLDREQLQGVIAHECSHILNGDMKINLRLIGAVHGILLLFLTGWQILRHIRVFRGSGKKGGGAIIAVLAVALILIVVGAVGWLFASLIKAAVNRQREYLADAAAVQFTRNPSGLAKALRSIATKAGLLKSERAAEVSHLFFAEGISSLFATHPPIQERIRLLEGLPQTSRTEPRGSSEGGTLFQGASAISGLVGTVRLSSKKVVSESLHEKLDDPFTARAVMLALATDQNPQIRSVQLAKIAQKESPEIAQEINRILPTLDRTQALSLVHLALPALRQQSNTQRISLLNLSQELVAGDGVVTLSEFILVRTLRRHLGLQQPKPTFSSWITLYNPAVVVLSALAYAGGEAQAPKAFAAGLASLPPKQNSSLLPQTSCDSRALEQALDQLEQATPDRKRTLVEAFANTVASDGRITTREGQLLRLLCDSLGCPLPLDLQQE